LEFPPERTKQGFFGFVLFGRPKLHFGVIANPNAAWRQVAEPEVELHPCCFEY